MLLACHDFSRLRFNEPWVSVQNWCNTRYMDNNQRFGFVKMTVALKTGFKLAYLKIYKVPLSVPCSHFLFHIRFVCLMLYVINLYVS